MATAASAAIRRGRAPLAGQIARAGYVLVAPGFALLVLISGLPVVLALLLSFTDYNLIQAPHWVGLANYNRLATDNTFVVSVERSAEFVVMIVPSGTAISLLVALLIRNQLRGMGAIRTIVYIPQGISWVATALIWSWLYNPIYGLIDHILSLVGVAPVSWTTDFNTAMLSIVIMSIWRDIGFFGIIFLAALQGIPRSLYEAASIDGANRFASFRFVTLPMLGPTLFFVVVIWCIGGMQMFTQAFVLTNGGPVDATQTVVYTIYLTAFQFLKMGYASAQAFALFVAIVALTLVNRRLFRDQEYEL